MLAPILCARDFSNKTLQVIWSYYGYAGVNYTLSEVKNPKRTVKIAGPVSVAAVTLLYLLANIAYFAGATKQEIATSGRLVAALLFRNVYGPQAERILDIFIAISTFGGVLSTVCLLACSLAGTNSTLVIADVWRWPCQSSTRPGRHFTF